MIPHAWSSFVGDVTGTAFAAGVVLACTARVLAVAFLAGVRWERVRRARREVWMEMCKAYAEQETASAETVDLAEVPVVPAQRQPEQVGS